MKFVKIDRTKEGTLDKDQFLDELLYDHGPNHLDPNRNKFDSGETAVRAGAGLGALALLKTSLPDQNIVTGKPIFKKNTDLKLGAAGALLIGGELLARRIADKRIKKALAQASRQDPDFDIRVSPYISYSQNRQSFATFANFKNREINIPLDKQLVDELDLNEREKYLGTASVPTRIAQAGLIAAPAIYAYGTQRKLANINAGISNVKTAHDQIFSTNPLAVTDPNFKVIKEYSELINSEPFLKNLQKLRRNRLLGIGASIAGIAAASELAKKDLKKRAQEKTNAYLNKQQNKFSINHENIVTFADYYKEVDNLSQLPLNVESPDVSRNEDKLYTLPAKTLGILGAGITAGGILGEIYAKEQRGYRRINKTDLFDMRKDLTNTRPRLKGNVPPVTLNKLSRIHPKTYANIGKVGLGLSIGGALLGVNSYNEQNRSYQRQLQSQAQAEVYNKRQGKNK